MYSCEAYVTLINGDSGCEIISISLSSADFRENAFPSLLLVKNTSKLLFYIDTRC